MIPSNYHTHTLFCDGKNTPEEIVREAIRLGCPELGFSGHSYMPFYESYCMTPDGSQEYMAAIRKLQETYGDKIRIYLGIELDYYSNAPTDDYDYVIGSVHYVIKDGCYLSVDESRELQLENVRKYYNGDFYAFIEDYFDNVADVYQKTRCQIVGHFDLVKKFNASRDLFDPQHPRYQAAAKKALDSLLSAPVILEVNSGGIARGYTTELYPDKEIVVQWLKAGKPVLFSSDCHDKEQLLFGYDAYENYIKACM